MKPRDSDVPINVLLVEDNEADVFMIRNSLQASPVTHILHTIKDGEAAIDFLYQRGQYSNAPRPHMIMLDLNLPKKDGREVLADLKRSEDLASIPVIIMTGSEAPQDILRAYQLHASCYLTKPNELNDYTETIKCIENFWFNCVHIPVDTPQNET